MEKNRIFGIKQGLIAFVFFVVCISVVYTNGIKVRAVGAFSETAKKWNEDVARIKMVPTSGNIFAFQRDHEWLKTKENAVKEILSEKKMSAEQLTPLQFKEELLSAQTKLKQLADIQGCAMAQDLGFFEFASGEIPKEKDVPLLLRQLRMIEEITGILLKNKAGEITEINKIPYVYNNDEDRLYRETAVKVKIRCADDYLLGILNDIINSKYFLVTRSVSISQLDDVNMSAELLVGMVEIE